MSSPEHEVAAVSQAEKNKNGLARIKELLDILKKRNFQGSEPEFFTLVGEMMELWRGIMPHVTDDEIRENTGFKNQSQLSREIHSWRE